MDLRFKDHKPYPGTPINKHHPRAKPPVCAWPISERGGPTLYDLSGNRNDGTFGAGTASPAWGGRGITFDGSDDVITVADSPSLDFSNSNTFSISVWVNTDGISDINKYVGIIGKGAYETNDEWEIMINRFNPVNTLGSVYFGLRNVGVYCTTTPLVIGEWTHIAAVYNGDVGKVYVNGSLRGTTGSVAYVPSASLLYIGRRHPSGYATGFWDGKIDNIRIWPYALTQTEVQDVYINPSADFEPDIPDWMAYVAAITPTRIHWWQRNPNMFNKMEEGIEPEWR